jgi:hypothetical protein
VSGELDATAQEIADRGRDALVELLRPAFAEAAAAHADVLELSDERLEAMVQRAADTADGLQWRRTLALVATDTLGIGLGEALSHPAVARAHTLAGAPSYEQSLAELSAAPADAAPADAAPAEGADDGEASGSDEVGAPAPPATPEPPPLRMAAVHVSGIAELKLDEDDLELVLSDAGVDIIRGQGEPVGRLPWTDIDGVDVSPPRSVRRRRRREASLAIRSADGQANFQIPAVSPEELRERLAPVLDRHGMG